MKTYKLTMEDFGLKVTSLHNYKVQIENLVHGAEKFRKKLCRMMKSVLPWAGPHTLPILMNVMVFLLLALQGTAADRAPTPRFKATEDGSTSATHVDCKENVTLTCTDNPIGQSDSTHMGFSIDGKDPTTWKPKVSVDSTEGITELLNVAHLDVGIYGRVYSCFAAKNASGGDMSHESFLSVIMKCTACAHDNATKNAAVCQKVDPNSDCAASDTDCTCHRGGSFGCCHVCNADDNCVDEHAECVDKDKAIAKCQCEEGYTGTITGLGTKDDCKKGSTSTPVETTTQQNKDDTNSGSANVKSTWTITMMAAASVNLLNTVSRG